MGSLRTIILRRYNMSLRYATDDDFEQIVGKGFSIVQATEEGG
jgi:hypothetical protein